jgi:hypothetical protein
MNKKAVLSWMIVYTIISFFGFFLSTFNGILSVGSVSVGALSGPTQWSHYMIYCLPLVFFFTPFIAWGFYKKGELRNCLLTSPVFPIAYIIVLAVLTHRAIH